MFNQRFKCKSSTKVDASSVFRSLEQLKNVECSLDFQLLCNEGLPLEMSAFILDSYLWSNVTTLMLKNGKNRVQIFKVWLNLTLRKQKYSSSNFFLWEKVYGFWKILLKFSVEKLVNPKITAQILNFLQGWKQDHGLRI